VVLGAPARDRQRLSHNLQRSVEYRLRKLELSRFPFMRTGIASPANAPRSLPQKRWTVVLRCFRCQRSFAVSKVTIDSFALPPQVIPCRHCGAQPSISPQLRLHKIVEMCR
jgi:hypothetical protein